MFDTYVTKQNHTEYIPYEKTISEIKAPTDESIKLLNEWKEKLMEQIVGVYRVENCLIDIVAVQTRDFKSGNMLLSIKAVINGETKYYTATLNNEMLLERSFVSILEDKINGLVSEVVRDILAKAVIKQSIGKNQSS